MILRITLSRSVHGWWNGFIGKDRFDFKLECLSFSPHDGKVKVGSWEANYWFLVDASGDERAVLERARMHLYRTMRLPEGVKKKFEIMEGP